MSENQPYSDAAYFEKDVQDGKIWPKSTEIANIPFSPFGGPPDLHFSDASGPLMNFWPSQIERSPTVEGIVQDVISGRNTAALESIAIEVDSELLMDLQIVLSSLLTAQSTCASLKKCISFIRPYITKRLQDLCPSRTAVVNRIPSHPVVVRIIDTRARESYYRVLQEEEEVVLPARPISIEPTEENPAARAFRAADRHTRDPGFGDLTGFPQ